MKQSAIEVIGYDKCTGCYGCLNTCPVHNAIEFKLTDEGFYKPFITNECVHCGYCQEGCPVIKKVNNNVKQDLEVYSCWSRNENIVKNSSSGGIFSELAKVYLESNGVVFGAKWQDGEIGHVGITKLEELEELQKSKYLQSKIEYSYTKVKEYLKEGKKVLFVGTPCEGAALRKIVDHKNLVIVDVVCHGMPSYSTYKKYVKEVLKKDPKNLRVDFRNKNTGWENYSISYIENQKVVKDHLQREDIWFKGFLSDVYLNKPCYNCEFRTLPRFADITLGDFWGVPQELKNINGTSVVTINSKKGKELFEKIKGNIEYRKTTFEVAYRENPCLYKHKLNDDKRAKFYRDFPNKSFEALHKKYFPYPSILSKIIRFPRRVLGFIKRKILKIIKGV